MVSLPKSLPKSNPMRHSHDGVSKVSTGVSGKSSAFQSSRNKKSAPKIKKVHDYIIFFDEVLGQG